ncbi:hypothetical protein ACUXK4_005194, partial [Methylorubrum extorquens]
SGLCRFVPICPSSSGSKAIPQGGPLQWGRISRGISTGGKDLADLLAHALMTGSDAAWDKLRRYGIQRIAERHPTEPAKVMVDERTIAVR